MKLYRKGCDAYERMKLAYTAGMNYDIMKESKSVTKINTYLSDVIQETEYRSEYDYKV